MLGTVQKLLKKENFDNAEKNDTIRPHTYGVLRTRHRTPHKIWLCNGCGHLYFYAVFKCPLCESKKIKNTVYNGKNILEKDVVIKEDGLS